MWAKKVRQVQLFESVKNKSLIKKVPFLRRTIKLARVFLTTVGHFVEPKIVEHNKMEPSEGSAFTRVSPLRGGLTPESIVDQTRNVRNGLGALRDEHYNILSKIRDEFENEKNCNPNIPESPKNGKRKVSEQNDMLLEDRIAKVTNSLEALELGMEESTVIITLYDHFNRLESDRSILRLEMNRVIDENDWLREELTDTQKR